MYRELDASKIHETCQKLTARINDRFPNASLRRVAGEVEKLAAEAVARGDELQEPIWHLRIIQWLLIALLILIPIGIVASLKWDLQLISAANFFGAVEAMITNSVYLGAALVYVSTLETRASRRKAQAAVHELRSLAHIVDMHQITKVPERILRGSQPTAASPQRTMTPGELFRYLDYCIELLSMIAKIGALYVQEWPDSEVSEAVETVEDLSTDLGRQIWQKMMAIDLLEETPPGEQTGERGA